MREQINDRQRMLGGFILKCLLKEKGNLGFVSFPTAKTAMGLLFCRCHILFPISLVDFFSFVIHLLKGINIWELFDPRASDISRKS